jgi:SNF2 family DNA or RNA helicase
MSKRLLKEAEDDTDEDSDGWFAQFNAVTSAQKSSEDAPVHSLPPTSKRTKKSMFLDDIDDDDEREEEKVPLCENLFGSINTVTAEKILTKLSPHKDIGNSQHSNSTSNSAEPKTQQRKPHDDFRDGYSESSGRASICISDEFRPVFDINFKRADKTIHLRSPSQFSHVDFLLNHHIARYLLDHQVEGILWLWSKYLDGKGVILADDMGMGKTIQITALISILFCKTGVGTTDLSRMRLRRQKETTTLSSSSSASFTKSHVSPSVEYYLQTKPCLIACPKSLVDNWYKEIQKWGYFTVDILNSKLDEQQRENIIDRADQGRSEIVLVSYSQIGKFHSRLSSISWSMIVFDEGHILKNTGIQLYQKMLDIKKTTFRLVATGTPIQNDLLELWSILHLIDAYTFANRQDFVKEYEKPIKLGMRSSADQESVAEGMLASRKLASLLEIYMLGRKKKLLESGAVEVSNHEDQVDDKQALLKGKDEVIVLCDLSPIQQELYQHCLSLPDFDNIRYHTSMCSCGSGKTRGKCCPHYRIPYRRDTAGNVLEPLTIDPRAAMWSNFHKNNEPCGDDKTQRCPLCVLLPCLSILSKIACHPALLQHDPNSARADKQEKLKRFVSHALTPVLVEKMGGPLRSTKFMDMKSTALSGKMKTLQDMLDVFVKDGQKTLVFSLSTQVLDMIEALVRSRGWTSLRLDGQTPSHRRQQLVDEFNDKSHISVFLISSRAGGLGLNLCTATKVIIFDVDWNPVVDMQSQDRAYRIGQKEHLVVYRLVSKGTIEEVSGSI